VKIVCAASVLYGKEAFETVGDTYVIPDARISREHVRDADALVIRSKTVANAALLEGSRVSFVGTATAGTDHLDEAFLADAGMATAAADGCNANSVAEYVVAALCALAARHGMRLDTLTVGVVGCGHIGSRVVQKAEALGMKTLRNDPPLQLASGDRRFLDLDRLLTEADLLSLHVPLTRGGPFPTWRMAGYHFFEHLKPRALFFNTSRGEVVDPDALLLTLEKGTISHAVLDVWDHEPCISRTLLHKVDVGTPHIAGYSFEGRLNGTVAVYEDLCRFFETAPRWRPDESRFPAGARVSVDGRGLSEEEILWRAIQGAYDLEADDRALRAGSTASDPDWAAHFNALRRDYGERREFAAAQVRLSEAPDTAAEKLRRLGFHVSG
jgi:erythronate-4-phosphate dehydrogenase